MADKRRIVWPIAQRAADLENPQASNSGNGRVAVVRSEDKRKLDKWRKERKI